MRALVLVYGLLSYAVGMASLVYMFCWLGNLIPGAIDSQPAGSIGYALAINSAVFIAFCVQHSVMARPKFKLWLTSIIPESAERSTYVLSSAIALLAVMLYWQPLGGTIWNATQPAWTVLFAVYCLGWAVLVGSTFALNHFDLFGLRQVWLQFRSKRYTHLDFVTPGPYKYVRHPLYVGWLLLAWATPTMTVAHFAFAAATTAYILVAIRWEERDLIRYHGKKYEEYRRRTPMLIPFLVGSKGNEETVRANG